MSTTGGLYRFYEELLSNGRVVVITPQQPTAKDIEETRRVFGEVIEQMQADQDS